jgi:hypothetical protein
MTASPVTDAFEMIASSTPGGPERRVPTVKHLLGFDEFFYVAEIRTTLNESRAGGTFYYALWTGPFFHERTAARHQQALVAQHPGVAFAIIGRQPEAAQGIAWSGPSEGAGMSASNVNRTLLALRRGERVARVDVEILQLINAPQPRPGTE